MSNVEQGILKVEVLGVATAFYFVIRHSAVRFDITRSAPVLTWRFLVGYWIFNSSPVAETALR